MGGFTKKKMAILQDRPRSNNPTNKVIDVASRQGGEMSKYSETGALLQINTPNTN